jgi:hypothetical protein
MKRIEKSIDVVIAFDVRKFHMKGYHFDDQPPASTQSFACL